MTSAPLLIQIALLALIVAAILILLACLLDTLAYLRRDQHIRQMARQTRLRKGQS